jgi:hypothetical protein
MSLVSCVQLSRGWLRKERDHPKELHHLLCSICKSPVQLETSNTNELGKAVHENCYAFTVMQRTEQFPSSLPHQSQKKKKWLAYLPN